MVFTVDINDKGKRLDLFLLNNLKDISRSRIKTLIENGNILLNDEKIKSGEKLRVGDVISVEIPEIEEVKTKPENIPLDIVYEDDDLAVINKAQGMVVHAGAGNSSGTLVNALLYNLKNLSGINGKLRPGIVHRLDKNTSALSSTGAGD